MTQYIIQNEKNVTMQNFLLKKVLQIYIYIYIHKMNNRFQFTPENIGQLHLNIETKEDMPLFTNLFITTQNLILFVSYCWTSFLMSCCFDVDNF